MLWKRHPLSSAHLGVLGGSIIGKPVEQGGELSRSPPSAGRRVTGPSFPSYLRPSVLRLAYTQNHAVGSHVTFPIISFVF